MAVDVRPLTAVLVLAVVLAAGTAVSVAVAEAGTEEPDPTTQSVPLEDADHELWLYTTPTRSFDRPTLAVNVVVYGAPEDVRAAFLRRGEGNWNETDPNESDVAPNEAADAADADPTDAARIEWDMADGSRRYAHLSRPEGGVWLTEAYQVHDGDYLGSRHHVRAYTAPAGDANWTALQAHHEHWDWFSGRHVVTSTDDSQVYVEREFVDERGAPSITRVPVGDATTVDFDHWVTVIDFRESAPTNRVSAGIESASSPTPAEVLASAALFVLVGAVGAVGARLGEVSTALRREFRGADARTVLLGVVIVAVLLSVRLTGIAIERSFGVPPKPVAFVLSPLLYVGLPVATGLLARPLDRTRAFAGASLGFLTALLVDYTYLGVTRLPLDLLVHRGTLAVALGLIAAGCTHLHRDRTDQHRYLRLGILLWVVATGVPLLRHTPLPV
ncbi:hypothetical protein [Haloparvum sp. PAK95]|uniref:hypothetical protein n=1 Tax=Haloparvum sp. PAK95 TaxID=3418962 RepID=UPI003D2EB36A